MEIEGTKRGAVYDAAKFLRGKHLRDAIDGAAFNLLAGNLLIKSKEEAAFFHV